MTERSNMVEFQGEPYISLEALENMVVDMVDFISKAITENPDAAHLAPGSEAVISMLNDVFSNIRLRYAASKDLAPEAAQTVKEIYDFLREQ